MVAAESSCRMNDAIHTSQTSFLGTACSAVGGRVLGRRCLQAPGSAPGKVAPHSTLTLGQRASGPSSSSLTPKPYHPHKALRPWSQHSLLLVLTPGSSSLRQEPSPGWASAWRPTRPGPSALKHPGGSLFGAFGPHGKSHLTGGLKCPLIQWKRWKD